MRNAILAGLLALALPALAWAAPPYSPTPQDDARARADSYTQLQSQVTALNTQITSLGQLHTDLTNLGTSGLAKESGGNLAATVAQLQSAVAALQASQADLDSLVQGVTLSNLFVLPQAGNTYSRTAATSWMPFACVAEAASPTQADGKLTGCGMDLAGNLKVVLGGALAAGSNVIGGVTLPAQASCNVQIKATVTACGTSAPHTLTGWAIGNTNNSTAVSVQIFDAATGSVTLGTTVPSNVIEVSAALGNNYTIPGGGKAYSTAISFACTTTDTGSSAPANNCNVTLYYVP